jgi:GT2 family glycosyltransferase
MVSILIVSWNTRGLLRDCLLSLRDHEARARLEIIVVDNASSDGSAAMVRAEFPGVTLIASDHNLGFAAGNNRAYAQSSGEWVWLLNPDTQVLAGALDALLDRFEQDERCGAVASALIDARDGHTQRSVRAFPTAGALWAEASGLARAFPRSRRFGFYRMGWWRMRDARPVEQPMASSLLLKRTVIEECGGLFDERFPIFFNDVDLCRRVVQNGWRIWFEPASRVRHWGGASTRLVRAAMIAESHRALLKYLLLHEHAGTRPLVFAATLLLVRLAGAARVGAARIAQAREARDAARRR